MKWKHSVYWCLFHGYVQGVVFWVNSLRSWDYVANTTHSVFESVLRHFEIASENNTSTIFKLMVRSVEMNSLRENPAVVSDALFMISKSKS